MLCFSIIHRTKKGWENNLKKVKVIYNPSSGTQTIQRRLDTICNILLDKGYILGKYATKKKYDAMKETIRVCQEDWDIIIACGGDGTISEVATGIVKGGRKVPVAILAAGTINDFANSLSLPKDASEFCKMVMNEKTVDADLGKVNNEYFVNTAGCGLFTNVAHNVPSEFKTVLGRLAYYIEGILEIPKHMFNSFTVDIDCNEFCKKNQEIFLLLITNSSYVGGFKKLSPKADISDGYLDVLIIKKSEIQDILSILVNISKGDHIKNTNVDYFRTKKINIQCQGDCDLDLDGEYGGKLPAVFEVVPSSFRIIVKK